jgi:hypothetical protein
MMKQTLHALGALTIAAALTMLSTACTNDDSLLADEPQASAVKTYTVSIPATMDGDETRAVTFDNSGETPTITRGFLTTEKIRVYNVTKGGALYGYLQPTSISTDGKSCTLTGELSGETTIEAGDELKLLYNLTETFMSNPTDYKFSYSETQDGTQADVVDGAVATVTVNSYTDGVLTTTTPASFQPQQSVFRLKFVDESNTPINVKQLIIWSKNKALVRLYVLKNNIYYYDDIVATLTTATTDYIYLAFIIKESGSSGDVLTFTVRDDDGNYYKGTKAAPEGGFKNGKYYYNTAPIQLTKLDVQTPTITWTTPDTPVEPGIYKNYYIQVWNSDITLSGISRGYKFYVYSGTIRLNGLNATYSDETNEHTDFIYSSGYLNLVINGENTINCKGQDRGVFSNGTLKLSGNGTLTVISNDHHARGLQSTDYKNYGEVSDITAEGYTVTVTTEPTNNNDGSYTWVYTVAPTE